MFILKDITTNYQIYKINDTKDIYDIVLGIEEGDEKKAQLAYEAACNMGFDWVFELGKIRLECVRDAKDSIHSDFVDDIEKMRDFFEISKEEFLLSYSYLDEEDYDLTNEKVKNMSTDMIEHLKKLCRALPVY